MPLNVTRRVLLGWSLIGAAGFAAIVLLIAGLFLPLPAKDLVHTRQLAAAVGNTDAVKIAEKTIASEAQAGGVTITSMHPVSVKPGKDGSVTVTLKLQTVELGSFSLAVVLSKSVYSVESVSRTG